MKKALKGTAVVIALIVLYTVVSITIYFLLTEGVKALTGAK